MRKAIWAIGLVLAVLAWPSQAEEAQRFPPYPDIWGVELPETEACNWGNFHLSRYRVTHYGETSGDRTFMFWGEISDEKTKQNNNAYSFFAQKYYVFNRADHNEEQKSPEHLKKFEKHTIHELTYRSQLKLLDESIDYNISIKNDNSIFEIRHTGWGEFLYDSGITIYTHKNKKTKYLKSMFIIQLLKQPVMTDLFSIKRYMIRFPERTADFPVQFIIWKPFARWDSWLDDGTALTHMNIDGWPIADKKISCPRLIVRFAPGMRSPFLEAREDFLFLDVKEVAPILIEATRLEGEDPKFNSLRFIHDQILEVLLKRKKPPE